MKNHSFFISLIFILTSCQITKEPAPIIYNHKKNSSTNFEETANSHDNIELENEIDRELSEIISPRNEKYDDQQYIMPEKRSATQNYKIIYHEVQVGEIIEDISEQYGQNIKEIAQLNGLTHPYELEEFQIIKIKTKTEPKIKTHKSTAEGSKIESLKSNKKPDFIKPVNGKILTRFGEKTAYGSNKGVSIIAKEGTKIVASTDGKIIYADYGATLGNLVIIKATDRNIVTSYAHMQDLFVNRGKMVKQGEVIGYVGNSGKVTKSQLHFGIREGKHAKDPMQFIQF